MSAVHRAPFADLDTHALYALLRLRAEVFVVEQDCVYLDPDGRDTEPGAVHWWIDDGGTAVATLRVLDEGDGVARIGRVATAAHHRNRGTAGQLLAAALADLGPGVTVRIDAQSPLVGWYRRLGFEISGAEFVEDGIAHVPMVRVGSVHPDPS